MTTVPVVAAALAPELHAAGSPVPSGPGMPTLVLHGSSEPSSPAYPAMPRAPHGTVPIARTRQGYDHAPGHGPPTPRSEPAPRFAAHELEGNVSLQPSHRLLYVGIGGMLIGIIVLLAISIADNRDEPATARSAPSRVASGDGPDPGSAVGAAPGKPEASKPEAGKPETVHNDSTVPVTGSPDPAGRRATIHLHVVSTPSSAEVSLSGKPLGVTPLDIDLERKTGSEPLTIHRARYQDVTVAVDVGRDYEQTVALVPLHDAGGSTSSGPGATERERPSKPSSERESTRSTRSTDRDGGGSKRTGLPPKEDCQPPDKINPYEKACHGHVCKPCPTP